MVSAESDGRSGRYSERLEIISTDVRYFSLQILRGYAAWLVVFHHFMQLFFGFKSDSAIGRFFSSHGDFGVDIFFVLSGFVMYFSARRHGDAWRQFLLDRIFRIAPVYWIYTSVMLLCLYCFPSEFKLTGVTLTSYIQSLFFISSPNPSGIGNFPLLTVGWTLNFEMFFYVLLAFCLLLVRRFGVYLCMVMIGLLPLFYPADGVYGWVLSSMRLHEFFAGLVLACLCALANFPRWVGLKFLFPLVCLGAVFWIFLWTPDKTWRATAIVLTFLSIEPFINLRMRWIRIFIALGNQSYSTYLAHLIVIGVVLHFSGKPESTIELLSTLLIVIFCTALISAVSFKYIEKNRFLDSLRIRLGNAATPRCRSQG